MEAYDKPFLTYTERKKQGGITMKSKFKELRTKAGLTQEEFRPLLSHVSLTLPRLKPWDS